MSSSFEKLLSNLPYNPSLVDQFRFYAKRMRRESSIRRTGLVFMVLTFFIQFFAVVSPPQPTVADSTNDLINGGFQTAAEAASRCRNDHSRHYQAILDFYGITCDELAKADTVSLKSTADGDQLYSMGWNPQGPINQKTGKKTDETQANIPGLNPSPYWRRLSSWDQCSPSQCRPYKALYIKATANHSAFYILFDCGNLVHVRVPIPKHKPKDVCDNVPGVQTTKDECDVCSNLPGIQTKPSECDVCTNIPGVQSKNKQCDLCPNKPGVQRKSKECDVCTNIPGVQTSKQQCDVCTNIPGTQTSTSQCQPCKAAQSSTNPDACVQRHKMATNKTQNIADADGTTAQLNDVITYKLTATNTGKITVANFVMQDPLSDTLDYADATNLDGGKLDTLGTVIWPAVDLKAGQTETHTITLAVGKLDANGQRQIPQTPASSSDGAHFDLIMTNVYGDTVNISVPGGVIKTFESTTTTLPNTGPGSSLLITGAIVVVAGYFFARARLLAEECHCRSTNS